MLMTNSFFSVVDQEALDLWILLLATKKKEWTMEEAVIAAGERLQKHLPRLLVAHFLDGDFSNFKLPNIADIIQLILEETYIKIRKIFDSEDFKDLSVPVRKFLVDLKLVMESLEGERRKRFGKSREEIELFISNAKNNVTKQFNKKFGQEIGEDLLIPQISPVTLVDMLTNMKNSYRQIITELEGSFIELLSEMENKSKSIYSRGLDKNNFNLRSDSANVLDLPFDNFEKNLEEKFTSFKRRVIASNEMFKLDAKKLSSSQVTLINNLENIIHKILQESLEELANKTRQTQDFIFINLRKSLDELSGNISDNITKKEDGSKESVRNLVNSVFTINQEILDELIEALNILRESSNKMKAGLAKNLDSIKESVQKQVVSSIEELQLSVTDIKEIETTTNQKVEKLSTTLSGETLTILDKVLKNIVDYDDTINQDLWVQIVQLFEKIQEIDVSAIKIIDEHVGPISQEFANIFEYKQNQIIDKITEVVNSVGENYVLVPKDKYSGDDALNVKDIIITDEISNFVKSQKANFSSESNNIVAERKINMSHAFDLQLKSVIENVNETKNDISSKMNKSLEDQKNELEETRQKVISTSEETLKEIKKNLEVSYSFIYESIEPINMRLNHFKDEEVPEFFDNSSEKVFGITDIIQSLIDKVKNQALKNKNRLQDQLGNSEMVILNEIEDLKIQVMSGIQKELTTSKKKLLETVEKHRSTVDTDINSTEKTIGKIVEKELNEPVGQFATVLGKIEDAIASLDSITEKEINNLKNEYFGLIKQIKKKVTEFSTIMESKLSDQSSKGIKDIEYIKNDLRRKVKKYMEEVIDALFVQIKLLGSNLGDNIKEQLAVFEKLNNYFKGEESELVKEMNTILDDEIQLAYLNTLKELNNLQKDTDLVKFYRAINEKAVGILHDLSEQQDTISPDFQDLVDLIKKFENITGKEFEFLD
jgi:hypothetical protein